MAPAVPRGGAKLGCADFQSDLRAEVRVIRKIF
jgi:hypothetical protein